MAKLLGAHEREELAGWEWLSPSGPVTAAETEASAGCQLPSNSLPGSGEHGTAGEAYKA
jgi:hypothetical protein